MAFVRRLPCRATSIRSSAFALALACLFLTSIERGLGQFDDGGRPSGAWEHLKLNPKTRVQLGFINASVDRIVSYYEKIGGTTIVRDPSLTGTLTVTSAKPVPLSEAFRILATTLSFKGYDLTYGEGMLIVRKRETRPKGNGQPGQAGQPRAGSGPGGWGGPGGGPQEPSVVRVYRIRYANASQLAQTLNQVFQLTSEANGAANGFPGMGGNGGFGGPGNGARGGVGPGAGGPSVGGPGAGGPPPPGGADAPARGQGFAQGPGSAPGQSTGQFPGQFPGAPTGPGGAPGQGTIPAGSAVQSQGPSYRASADDYTNSIVVYAPERVQAQVKELIDQLDKPSTAPQNMKVYKLRYASSDDLVSVIQNVLNANAPRGRGGATLQQTQGPGAFLRAASGSVAGAGQVSSDPRTNSLVVTATDDNLRVIDGVVADLDREVTTQSSVFVFPLANAQSDGIASLLQQAFGQRQGTGTGSPAGQTSRTTSGTTNSGGSNGGGMAPGGGFGGGPSAEIPIRFQDPNATEGTLLTQVGVTQVLGPQIFGGGQPGQSRTNQGTAARDPNGRVVNTADLTGQVTTISDPNTNSIIVVTTPENAEIIRRILDQLDRIPEQVMIEATIVEASLDASQKLGVEWQLTSGLGRGLGNATGSGGTDFGNRSASATLQGFSYTISSSNFSAFLNALKTDQKFQVLSAPRIFTSNNVQAEINISQSVPYIVSSQQDANGNFTYNYSFEDVGIVLTVTPHITKDGYVTMDVSQTANDLQGYTTFNAPIINQRAADTTVSVKDGQTIILGGIIRSSVSSTVSKVPLLGDIPLLGKLFRSTSRSQSKTELLVFMTPRIVRSPEDARRLREESKVKRP